MKCEKDVSTFALHGCVYEGGGEREWGGYNRCQHLIKT